MEMTAAVAAIEEMLVGAQVVEVEVEEVEGELLGAAVEDAAVVMAVTEVVSKTCKTFLTSSPLTRMKQVAQGQYVVSDTRCPALSDCELE